MQRRRPARPFGWAIAAAGFAAYLLLPPSAWKDPILGIGALLAAAWLYVEFNFVCYVTMTVDQSTGIVDIQRRFIGKMLHDRLAADAILGIRVVVPELLIDTETGQALRPRPGLELELVDGRTIMLVLPSLHTPFSREQLTAFCEFATKVIAEAAQPVRAAAARETAEAGAAGASTIWRPNQIART